MKVYIVHTTEDDIVRGASVNYATAELIAQEYPALFCDTVIAEFDTECAREEVRKYDFDKSTEVVAEQVVYVISQGICEFYDTLFVRTNKAEAKEIALEYSKDERTCLETWIGGGRVKEEYFEDGKQTQWF